MSNTIYIIEEAECDSYDAGNLIGYCTTLEEAKRKCAELTRKNSDAIELWNEHCSKCLCGTKCFRTKEGEDAIRDLNRIQSSGCPHAKSAEFRELTYGSERKSGGFEICCDHMIHDCCNYTYIIRKCERID